MKNKSKLLSLFLALTMVLSLVTPAMAVEVPEAGDSMKGKLVILHTNDTHGGDVASEESIGTAGVAQLKKDYEAAGAEVLLLSGGDAIQGAPIVNLSQGATAIEFMNAAGYDAMCPGNHEFDWGADNLKTILEEAEFPVLAANVVDEKTGKPLFEANTIFTTESGLKVGVFGLDTPETATKTNPEKIKGVKFLAGEELYACAKAQVAELEKAGCDLIVALGHLGVDEETAATGNRSVDLCNNVEGIDLFVDGHSHTVMADGKPVDAESYPSFENKSDTLIVSTGTKLANVGVVVYDKETDALSAGLVEAGSYTGTDETVAKTVNDKNTEVDNALSAIMGKTEVDLNGERAPGVRTEETNLGDFATDALLWFAQKQVGEQVVAAITNGGGIRASIPAGDISMKTMNTVFPFGNTVVTLTVTGQQLLEALEAATYCAPTAIGAFPQVAGVTFTVDTNKAYENGAAYGTYFECANPGNRVINVTVGGEALDLEKEYTIATNDFTAVGGDTYYSFKEAYTANGVDTGIPLDQALSEYTSDVLGGTITAEKYGKPAGRITVLKDMLADYSDLSADAWYADAARYVLSNSYMNGTGKGNFTPSGTVTRGTVYQTLYNMAGKPTVAEAASFTDVAGKWYADAAAWAEDESLTTGIGKGLFGGDVAMTRQELAKVFADYAQKNNILPQKNVDIYIYGDVADIASWAMDGVTSAVALGIITGNKNLLNPTGTAMRTELAQILKNYGGLEPTYVETEVSIPVAAQDGIPAHEIPATLTLPTSASKDAKVPGVVMLHGTGSDRDEAGLGYAIAAPAMASFGVATLRIDFMGSGDSVADYVNYNYSSANIDAKAAADYLAKLDMVDGENLGVMGWSQGGTNALLAAAAYPETFKAVVTWAGALDLTTMFEDFDGASATAAQDGSFEMTFDWRESLQVGKRWFEEVKETDVLAEVAKIKAPVMAIQGADDVVVPPDSALAIKDAVDNENSLALTIRECDHTFNVFSGDFRALNEAINAGAGFFLNNLRAASGEAVA